MISAETVILEVGKIILQLAGAGLIGWFGVRWALGRYKLEKTWERRLGAYTDLLAAITDMQRVLSTWQNAIETNRDLDDEETIALRAQYDAGLKGMSQSQGLAGLLFPQAIGDLLHKLPIDLKNASYNASTHWEAMDNSWGILRDGKIEIVAIAQAELGIRS